MKKFFWIGLVLIPHAAVAAGLDITWNSCVGSGIEALNQDFACSGTVNQNYVLEFQFRSPADLPGFVSVTAYVDLIQQNPGPLAPFWQYATGACNGGTIKGARVMRSIPREL